MSFPPPLAHRRVAEVEEALPLAVVRAPALRPCRPRIALGKEEAARLRFREEGRGLVEHRVLVRGDLEVLRARLLDHAPRIGPERGIEAQMTHAAIPPSRLAIARQVDEAVARDAFLSDGAGEAAQLRGALEVTRRLQEAERPTGRQWRAAEQLRHVAHHGPHVAGDEDVVDERARGRRVEDAHAAVGPAHADLRVRGVVEEESIAALGDEERDAHVRAWPMPQVGIPELAARAEPVEAGTALAQPVKVLLARELEGGVHATKLARELAPHTAVLGLAEQPLPRRVEEAEPSGLAGQLDAEIRGSQPERLALRELPRDGGPAPLADVGRSGGRRAVLERHANDAGAADGEGDPCAVGRDAHGRSTALEAWGAGGGGHERRR